MTESIWGKEKQQSEEIFWLICMFIILIVVMASWVYTYVKTDQIVYFKRAICAVYCFVSYISVNVKKKQNKTTPNLENVLYSHYYYSPTFIKKNRFLLSKANASCWAGCLQYLSVPWYPVSTLPASFCRSISIPGCKISPRQL